VPLEFDLRIPQIITAIDGLAVSLPSNGVIFGWAWWLISEIAKELLVASAIGILSKVRMNIMTKIVTVVLVVLRGLGR